jgi:hypothetical protein
MTIKALAADTLTAIQESPVINVSFVKYGSHAAQTKITFTYYNTLYAFTAEAWASITPMRWRKLAGYGTIADVLKPMRYTFQRINKATGVEVQHSSEDYARLVFNAVCKELATMTDKVYLDHYLQYRRVK